MQDDANGVQVVVTLTVEPSSDGFANVTCELAAAGEEWMVDAVQRAVEQGGISEGLDGLARAISMALGEVIKSRPTVSAGRPKTVGRA